MKILSTQVTLPATQILSSDLDQELGIEAGRSFIKTGVESTYRVQSGEELLGMATEAFEGAMDKASLSDEDLDLLIFAGASKAQVLPCTAALIQGAAGHAGYGCFDVDATCLSFLRAFEIASAFLNSGSYSTIAVVVAESSSTHLNPKDTKTYPLFGDGAVCYLISNNEQHDAAYSIQYKGSYFETYGEFGDFCQLKGGLARIPAWECDSVEDLDFRFQMDGRKLYAATAKLLPAALKTFLNSQQISIDECDWVVPHQASGAAMNLMSTRLNIPQNKLVNILKNSGNQVSASLPIALDHLLNNQSFDTPQRVLLIGSGAGLGVGLTLLEIGS